jgi:Flp pilus assembly protein TadG
MVGMVAFAVDFGWIVSTQAELQSAADAAALAGAQPLMDGFVQYQLAPAKNKTTVLNSVLASARASAKTYAGYNAAGGVKGLALNDGDIEFGFIDAKGTYTALPTYTGFPNTVKVTLRRDGQANGSLKLFFAPVLGQGSADLQATAAATIYAGVTNSLIQNPPQNMKILPMTYDVNAWNNFVLSGQNPDGVSTLDNNGVPELQVYPSVKDKGNFGELSLDNSHAGSSDITSWIDTGMSAADVQALTAANLLPLSQHDATKWDWLGNPGLKAATIKAVNSYQGQTFIMPLFKPYNASDQSYQAGVGQGSGYYYNIVQFQAVRIILPSQTNKQVVIQPAAYIDPDLVFSPSTVVPAGSSGQFTTTFTTPRLSR